MSTNPELHARKSSTCIFNFKYTKLMLENNEKRAPTFNKGMCTLARVLFGVIKAVSNSSAENSTFIFKRGLKIFKSNNNPSKPYNK